MCLGVWPLTAVPLWQLGWGRAGIASSTLAVTGQAKQVAACRGHKDLAYGCHPGSEWPTCSLSYLPSKLCGAQGAVVYTEQGGQLHSGHGAQDCAARGLMSPADQVACLSTLASLESGPMSIHVMKYKKAAEVPWARHVLSAESVACEHTSRCSSLSQVGAC